MSNCERIAQVPHFKKRLWANRSGHSWQMSDREQFAQVPHDKWANEQIAGFFLSKSLIRWQKTSHLLKIVWLKLYFWYVFVRFFLNERFAHSFFFNERCERISQVAHQKWAMWANLSGCSPKMSNVSESLRLLTKNEWSWAIRSGSSPKMSDHERFLKVSNERIALFFEKKSLIC